MATVSVEIQSSRGVDPSVLVADEAQFQAEALARYFDSEDGKLNAGDPVLTRNEKKARKGLPTRANLEKLASVWLTNCHKHPHLVQAGLVPANTPESVRRLAAEFEHRFINGTSASFSVALNSLHFKAFGAAYLRYSCDNSNPRSLDDQLDKAQNRAFEEGRFIPWEMVFADASVSGRTHLRRGYRMAKDAMENFKQTGLDTLYIDDFGRASRDALESYRLAKRLERLHLRLIGVSDGFDLNDPNAQLKLLATAMFNEMFVSQLRTKVLATRTTAGRWDGDDLLQRLHERLDQAGIQHGVLHTFRHTGASLLANNPSRPMPLPHLQKFLGHKSIKTTQRYLHSNVDDVAAAIQRIDLDGTAALAKELQAITSVTANGTMASEKKGGEEIRKAS